MSRRTRLFQRAGSSLVLEAHSSLSWAVHRATHTRTYIYIYIATSLHITSQGCLWKGKVDYTAIAKVDNIHISRMGKRASLQKNIHAQIGSSFFTAKFFKKESTLRTKPKASETYMSRPFPAATLQEIPGSSSKTPRALGTPQRRTAASDMRPGAKMCETKQPSTMLTRLLVMLALSKQRGSDRSASPLVA